MTGSSGAGTTTVKRAFEHIFLREKINAAVVEGDSFHSLSRVEFKEAVKKAEAEGNRHFQETPGSQKLQGQVLHCRNSRVKSCIATFTALSLRPTQAVPR